MTRTQPPEATLTERFAASGLLVDTGGTLYETAAAAFSVDRRYRYALTRQWDADQPWVTFVMLNPSTADAFRIDPTVTRCCNRARKLGAGGLLVLNLFAVRATDPRVMRTHPDPVGRDNDRVIADCVRTLAPTVIVAWGADAMVRKTGRDDEVLHLLAGAGVIVQRIGPPTAAGHPRHPLYLPTDAALEHHEMQLT